MALFTTVSAPSKGFRVLSIEEAAEILSVPIPEHPPQDREARFEAKRLKL